MSDLDFLQNEPQEKPKRGGLSAGSIVLIIGVLAVVLVLGIQLARQNQPRPMPGSPAPDFTMTTFDGQAVNLSDYRGQVVVVNFWGSWCGPCRAEAPDLQDIHETYQDRGVVVFGVNWLDIEQDALDFMDEFGLTYPNAPDVGERVAESYNIEAAPETFVIGKDGVVVETLVGVVNYDILAAILDGLVGSGS